jgi:nucleotide-binding universal stress UspA family protein
MYKKIMVPLDGSELAECVLPHVETIVRGCELTQVVLVRVAEPTVFPALGARGDESQTVREEDVERIRRQMEDGDARNRSAAEQYLSHVAGRLTYEGVTIETKVPFGDPSTRMADYAEESGSDLIVIATHGRSGPSRWLWGSVADRILRAACVPVLMVRAPGCVPGI